MRGTVDIVELEFLTKSLELGGLHVVHTGKGDLIKYESTGFRTIW